MTEIIVIDDWLPEDLKEFLKTKFLFFTPHWYSQKSTYAQMSDDNVGRFSQYEYELKRYSHAGWDEIWHWDDSIIQYLAHKVMDELFIGLLGKKSVDFRRIYLNIQYQNQNGAFHHDDGDMTVMYMVTPTPVKGCEFEYKDPETGETGKIEFKQNRLIAFPAKMLHRGIGPQDENPRITLAFKTNVIK